MFLVIEVLVIIFLMYFCFKLKYGLRDAAFAKLPTPKKNFLLHNVPEFLDATRHGILATFKNWHKELGNIYLLTFHPFDSGCVVVADHKIAEAVSLHQPNRLNAQTYKPLARWVGKDGYLMSGDHRWKTYMKPVLTAYSPKNYERSILIINQHANECVEVLMRADKFPHDLLTFFRQTTLDISFDTLLDFQLNAKNGSHFDYVQALNRFAVLGMRASIDPICRNRFLHPLTGTYRHEKKVLKIMHGLTLKIVKDRREEIERGEIVEDKLTVMLNHYLVTPVDGRILSDNEIRAELDSSIMGTHESTKATLTFVFYHLAKYPEVQEKVFEEAKLLLAENPRKHLNETQLRQVPYTESMIKETLRMFPPIPFVARKLESELTTGGYTFPKDVEVMISLYLMGRNPEYFDKPDEFIPGRLLGVDMPPTGYNPFSIGTRKCSGSKLAMVSLKTITLKIVYNYKVSLPKDFQGMTEVWQQILEPKNKLHLDLERRK